MYCKVMLHTTLSIIQKTDVSLIEDTGSVISAFDVVTVCTRGIESLLWFVVDYMYTTDNMF